MKRIINTTTNRTIWRGENYVVDGIEVTSLPSPLVLATDVRAEPPTYDAATQKLVRIEDSLVGTEWRMNRSTVEPLTQAELDERAEQVAQEDEEQQVRQVVQALRDSEGTAAERLRRLELVCIALIRRTLGR